MGLALYPAPSVRAQDGKEPQAVVSGKPAGAGWIDLIDGLKGWKFESEYWKMNGKTLDGVTPGTTEHHYAYTEKLYADFEMHADVKLVGYNSGICIRIKPTNFDDVPGYQVDMGEGYWGCLWDERGRGMVAAFDPLDAAKLVKKNDWNHYYVRANGHHIEAWLNGTKTLDVFDDKGLLTGPIGFQLTHGKGNRTEASFRNVYLRPLKK
jgi:hypothetical protein